MAYANTISGLKARRIELIQKAENLRAEAASLMNDKAAIEQVLRSLGDTEFEDAPRPYNITFERGQLNRFVCDYLREQGKATTRDVTLAIIEKQQRDPDDKAYYAKIQQAVSRCLAHMSAKGRTERLGASSHNAKAYEWRLSAQSPNNAG